MVSMRAALGAGAAVALVTAGCGSSSGTSSPTTAVPVATTAGPAGTTVPASGGTASCNLSGKVIGYSEPLPDPNFKVIEQGISAVLAAHGASLKAVNANLDPNKQISDVQSLLQSNINALLINPVAPQAVQGVLGQVRSAGIPIIVQDTKFGGPYTTDVQADVEDAASQGAAALKAKVGSGQVAAIFGPNFAETLTRESSAFQAAAKADGLNLVTTAVNQQITPDGAQLIAQAWKTKYGSSLAGIWTFNDTSAEGVVPTLDASFNPTLVSINGQPEAIPLVSAGKIAVTYDLQQDMLARALAYAAVNALCKQTMPDTIWVGIKKLDASNVSQYLPLSDRVKQNVNVTLTTVAGRSFVSQSLTNGSPTG